MKPRFFREIWDLKRGGTVRPHLPVNGRCLIEHVPSGKTATLILDPQWPWLSPTIEHKSGERFQLSDESWVPAMRMVDFFPSFFTHECSEWIPIQTLDRFQP